MSKRNDVLALLHVAGQSGATCNITADLLAELCKAWLALDDAPEATAYEGLDPETIEISAWDTGIAPGTTVRLVATHSAGGE